MITKKQGISYATITLDLLYKMKIKVSNQTFAEQMKLIYDLYEPDEVEALYENIIRNNRIIENSLTGRASCYVINIYNTKEQQLNLLKNFCKDTVELGKIYLTTPGENADNYYKLIQDIRNKNMDFLLVNVFTILGMSEKEFSIIKHLCRENNIILIEVWKGD